MKWKLGDMVHGFRVKSMSHIEEVNSDAYVMEHVKSGARLMYLDNDDDNKVFYIAFRTTPDNSKGVPHIMEHSTLCGSRKYPLKEPFVELAKGSLNTFLNAITWPDKTMYPIASRNDVDFHNLMDVYLDAVFYPNCLKNPQILMQEGWHYELENKEAPLTYNGVVYNEMKGALSSPEAIMEDRAMEKLFPDTTYGVESGGDPEVIPTLSFREFTEFHRRFYHPSNSYIYLYGDMDIDKTLEYLDREYLSAFDRRNVDSMVKTQAPFGKRISVTAPYGIAENEDTEGKAIHALYNAFNDHMSTMDSLAFRILNYVLIDMDGAPLKQAVLDAGLGNDLSGSYGDSYKQPVWIVEVTGSEVDKQQAFADVVDSTLRSIALKGLDKDMLEAALNRTEFTARENDYQGRPKGLFYGVRAMDLWLYDRDPMEALRYIDDINTLRDNLKTNYFENLLLRYVIKNPHQVLITMKPEKGLTEKMNRETAEKLAAFKSSLSDEQLDEIMASTKALKERQASGETEEALETIPLLSRKDLKRTVEEEVLERENVSGMDHFHFDVHTNGITYLNLYFPLSGLTEEDVPYAILLSTLLRSLSTTKHSYGELARMSNAYTGGMSFAVNGYGKVEDTNAYLPALTVRAKALTSKADKLLDLLGEVINHTLFTDTKRLKELILQEKSEWDMTAFSRGHSLVMTRLTSYFSRGGEFAEQSGLSYYYFLADLAKKFDGEKEKLVAKLEEVSRKIFTRSGLFFETIGEEEEKKAVLSNLSLLVDDMEEGEKKEPRPFSFPPAEKNEAFRTSGKVQYVAKGGNFKSHGFAYTGALKVMETILRYEYLWKKVRVLGGAYGAFTQFLRDGTAILCSYRDPNLAETLKAYEDLPAYLENLTLSDREMTKYVIGTMAAAETQLTPSMKGERAMVHYFSGNTRESRMKIRDEVINCQVEDIRKLAPLVESVMKDPYICVMGSEDKIERDKDLFDAVKSMPN
ncbi:insulinase family protein [uncultured Dialister sp.]|uniref:insulinase family protein n=1 Tax=uncultured Dialister sp. TaxID=278064 RepID=UPI0026073C2F|nr:insulinase family protein [uncultured Dialister sp.]